MKKNQVSMSVFVKSPEQLSFDELSMITDDELFARMRQIEADKAKADSYGQNLLDFEVEAAYAQREHQLRIARRKAHDAWMREELAAASEVGLPAGDFDNSDFLKSIGMWGG